MDKIYVKEEDIPKTRTRKDFIRKFIRGKGFNTYTNPECTDLQCEKGRFRSITELHKVVLSRFPITTFEAMLRIVKELIDEDASIMMIYCTQVNKVVLRYYDRATRSYMSGPSREHHYNRKGVDGYSLEDYEKIINNLNK